MTRVAVVGGLSIDHLVHEGMGARFNQAGGPGLFGSLGARLVAGTQTELIAQIPDDGGLARLLESAGVSLALSPRGGPAVRVWMLTDERGRMVVPVRKLGEPELVSGDRADEMPSVEFPAAERFDAVLLSAPDRQPHVDATVIGVDPHQSLVARHGMDYYRWFDRASVFLPSRVQLTLIDPDPAVAAVAMFDATGVPVIGRLDAEGMLVLDQHGLRHISDPGAEPVETTGAGDASAAAIVAALGRGLSLDEATRFGVSIARIAISDWGDAALLAARPLDSPFPDLVTTTRGTTP